MDEARRPRGRRPLRRPGRESVPALFSDDWWDDDYPEDGSAGVREPRNPRPQPLSGAGAALEPDPPVLICLR
ncbi:MAG TPA: hypothetical protein VGD67_07735 [Pseudonocardiaceae bacterium]